VTAYFVGDGFSPVMDPWRGGIKVMSQQSVMQAARRSALDAQAVLRKGRADRERRFEGLTVLTALGERDRAVQDGEVSAGEALRTRTDVEALSVREAVDWCGRGVTVREITRLRDRPRRPAGRRSRRTRRMSVPGEARMIRLLRRCRRS
jgi:hypothetical protein